MAASFSRRLNFFRFSLAYSACATMVSGTSTDFFYKFFPFITFSPLVLIGNMQEAYNRDSYNSVMSWIQKVSDPLRPHGKAVAFKCGLCGKVCNDRSNVRRHMITQHLEATHNPCSFCLAIFPDKYKLNEHLRHCARKTSDYELNYMPMQ